MGDIQFNGTPEEWDALVKKNKEKEEPKPTIKQVDYVAKKQETLEEAAIINCESITHPYCDREKAMFIKGAKWQQERMYSAEEVIKLVDGAFHMYASSKRHDAKEWLVEQFKKK